jgi:GNAT superfamily N-acetyltransferase
MINMKSLKDLSLQISEEQYRENPALSYSLIATYAKGGFASIPHLYDKKESDALTFGSMVDTIITEGIERFQEKFVIADFKIPTDSIKEVIDYLLEIRTEEVFEDIPDEWVCPLCGVGKEDFEPVEDTIAVERVPAEMVGDWSEMVAEAFGKPTEKPGMLLLADHPECYFLMHRVDGKMVAGMLLYCKNGNAGIHEVGTLEAYRGKGIAKALLLHALSIAKKQGCTCATLQASPMGVPVYESLGFEDVGTVNTWLILPPGVVL